MFVLKVAQLIAQVGTVVRSEPLTIRVHEIILPCIGAVRILTIDTHVRSHVLCNSKERRIVRSVDLALIVLVVVRIGQGEVGQEAYAVRHVVVKCHTRGELLELLLDDRTRLVLVAGRDTEGSLLTAAGEVEVDIMHGTELLHGLHPVGIVVPVLVITP